MSEQDKLTDEQIENWRRIMIIYVGPYALVMTKAQIQEYRDKLQSQLQEIDK